MSVLGWEYRVWKRKLYYERNRLHFPGSTPYYGKMWGYEADLMIEESLEEGDLVFWSVDPLSIHITEAICRFPYRHLKGDYDAWDFCGVIKKVQGRNYVIGLNGEIVSYSNLVADYRTRSLAVRKSISSSRSRFPVSDLDPSNVGEQVNVKIEPRGFLELSIKTIAKKFDGNFGQFLLSLLRSPGSKYAELDELFTDPFEGEYGAPFFVRKLDSEYYNHNRTRNIIVEWDLLMERDQKNKMFTSEETR